MMLARSATERHPLPNPRKPHPNGYPDETQLVWQGCPRDVYQIDSTQLLELQRRWDLGISQAEPIGFSP
jgi:hypothetical protein